MRTFDNSEFEKYRAEACEKWGQTEAYQQHEEKTKHYSKDRWNSLAEEMDGIMAAFAACMRRGTSPGAAEAQALVKTLQNHICENYYPCTNEILSGLGQMYVADDRFRTNIDKYAEGTAAFVREAIEAHCSA